MKKMSLCFLSILLLINISCNTNKIQEHSFNLKDFQKEITINEASTIEFDNIELLDPRWIKFHPDSFLILIELKSDPQIKIIDLKNNSVQEVIKKGMGPDELLGAWGLSIINSDIWVFGINQGIWLQLKHNNNRIFEIDRKIELDIPYVISAVLLPNEETISLNMIDAKNRLLYFDSQGKLLEKFSHFSDMFTTDTTSYLNNDAFIATTAVSPNNEKIVLGCNYIDLLEIVDFTTKKTNYIRGPFNKKFKANLENNSLRMTPSLLAYMHSYANNESFYILYSGIQNDEVINQTDIIPKQIFNFSWEGEPLNIYQFNEPVVSFDIDEETNTLFYITYNEEFIPIIKSFRLNE